MNVQEIKNKIAAGQDVTQAELNFAVQRDIFMLMNALMDNNLADVNVALKMNLKNDFLPVVPDRKAIEGVILGYINSNNKEAIKTILREFDYNPNANNYTGRQQFLKNVKHRVNNL